MQGKPPTCHKSLTLSHNVVYPEKTTDLQTLSHDNVSSTSRLSGIRTHISGDRH
jgi:hypothetical protein